MEQEKIIRELISNEVEYTLGKKVRAVGFLCDNEYAEYYMAFGNGNRLICNVEVVKADGGGINLVY